MKILEEIKREIDPTEWYRPSQIARYKWMIGFQGKNSYYYILELVKSKKIPAINFGKGKTKYWRIIGDDLIKYLEKLK